MSVSSPPPPFLPAHLLLQSFSMYLLNWPKLGSQRAALGLRRCGTCTSSPTAPSGLSSPSNRRHSRPNAHAQRRADVWRGRGRSGRSRDAQTSDAWRGGQAGAPGRSDPGTRRLWDIDRYTTAVRDFQVPRPNGAHLAVHRDEHKAPGKWGPLAMDWGAHAEMNTPGRHRAIGQLPNLTDFRDSFLT